VISLLLKVESVSVVCTAEVIFFLPACSSFTGAGVFTKTSITGIVQKHKV
jgi:hypothetical protein